MTDVVAVPGGPYDPWCDRVTFVQDGELAYDVDRFVLAFYSHTMIKSREDGTIVVKRLSGRKSVGHVYWCWATDRQRILLFPSYEFFLRVFIRILDVRERGQLRFENPQGADNDGNGVLAGVLVTTFEPDMTADPSDELEGLKVLDPDAFAYAQTCARAGLGYDDPI